jgi:hypothetical protein
LRLGRRGGTGLNVTPALSGGLALTWATDDAAGTF